MAVTKALKSARPTTNAASGKVIRWDVEVTFKDGEFERDYSYSKEIAEPSKAPAEYTKAELLGFAPAVLDEVFAHHKEVFSGNYQPETETDNEFDLDSLAAGKK